MNVGIIGLGVISKYYLEALNNIPDIYLKAVCDIKEEKIVQYKNEGIFCSVDYKDIISNNDVDAVIINVPNNNHFEICRDALLAGKHVCCEKPLCINIEDAYKILEISKQEQKTLFTAFHRRYNSNFKNFLNQIENVNNIKSVHATYLEKIEDHSGEDSWYLQPEYSGGGCIADNGPNVFDTLSYFLGKMDVVSSEYKKLNGIDLEAVVQLTTKNNISIQVDLDWAYEFGEKKDITVTMKDGSTVYCNMLDCYPTFKSSLYHEYEEILKDFVKHTRDGNCYGEQGVDAVRLVIDSYNKVIQRN